MPLFESKQDVMQLFAPPKQGVADTICSAHNSTLQHMRNKTYTLTMIIAKSLKYRISVVSYMYV